MCNANGNASANYVPQCKCSTSANIRNWNIFIFLHLHLHLCLYVTCVNQGNAINAKCKHKVNTSALSTILEKDFNCACIILPSLHYFAFALSLAFAFVSHLWTSLKSEKNPCNIPLICTTLKDEAPELRPLYLDAQATTPLVSLHVTLPCVKGIFIVTTCCFLEKPMASTGG